MPDLENLETDFADGTHLVALVEALQKRKLRHNKRPLNQHHELENIAIALDAIKEDGIKLVNIGRANLIFINFNVSFSKLYAVGGLFQYKFFYIFLLKLKD